MQYKFFLISLIMLLVLTQNPKAAVVMQNDTTDIPVIEYTSSAPKYEIAEITVTGADNYEDFVLIGFSGLAVGEKISVPGDEITNAVKRFWRQGLFADVKISATKIEGDKVWLNIALKQRPRVSQVNYIGLKKGEIEELEKRLSIVKGNQITPNISDRAKKAIEKFMEEKGFLNVEANVLQRNDPEKAGHVIVDIEVDKKLKTRVAEIIVNGNKALSFNQINKTMKKTNDRNWRNFFRSKKFVQNEFEKDKIALVEKYNEIGYRDAYIISDSIAAIDEKNCKSLSNCRRRR